jgi:hypothetical protein
MGKRRRVYLSALGIGIIAIAGPLLFRPSLPPQPYYQGRSLDSWLDEWTTNQYSINSTQYTKVVAAIGTNAIPFILRRLERDDSFLKNKFREIRPKLPGIVQRFLPKRSPISDYEYFSASMASRAFEYCGSNAVPLLLPKMKDGNAAVREACITSLFGLVRNSMTTNEMVLMVLPCLDDSDAWVRVHAVNICGQFGPAASNAIPALIRNLQSDETGRHKFSHEAVFVRANSAVALGRIGPTAIRAVPALTNLMASTNSYARACAASAVWEITSNANLTLPVVMSEFPTFHEGSKPALIQTFSEMGPLAKAAVPMLIAELTNSDPHTLKILTNALKRIDLEAAEKAGIR